MVHHKTTLPVNIGSSKNSSSSEELRTIHISERVQGAFFLIRRMSSEFINCWRMALSN